MSSLNEVDTHRRANGSRPITLGTLNGGKLPVLACLSSTVESYKGCPVPDRG
jgi:hypothetical protein